MQYKIDLHTHSIVSPDGGITERQYEALLKKGIIDIIAITDHNSIDFALKLQKKLGNTIIVGEEIMAHEGEIIGLFLQEVIPSGLSARETVSQIKKQGGFVLIPHPFETFRKGMSELVIEDISKLVDAVEVFNGRSLQPQTRQKANHLVKKYDFAPACNSDSHCLLGIGKTYSIIEAIPNAKSLKMLLSKSIRNEKKAPFLSLLCSKINRIRKLTKLMHL